MRPIHLLGPIVANATTVQGMAFDFETVYQRWFDDVQRWLWAMGARGADVDDLTQELFVIVDRKLPQFDGGNLPGWLYGIARRLASAHRRKLWVRSVFLRQADRSALDGVTPAVLFERKEARAIVERVMEGMTAKRRRVFALFEIEGYSGEEIAELEGIAINTVWTRLFHARRDFVQRVTVVEAGRR
jgi:RNA polymerase sigma-70 factor (ECF subfamily)